MKETESNTKQCRLVQCSYLSSWSRPISLKENLKKIDFVNTNHTIKILLRSYLQLQFLTGKIII